MANVPLFQPMNLTVHSSLGRPIHDWSGDWMLANYPGGVRVIMHDRYGDDSGYCDVLKITKFGAPVLEASGFVLDANGDWAEIAADRSDMLPFYTRILVGADRITGSADADIVDGYGGADWMDGGGGNEGRIGSPSRTSTTA